MLERKTRKLIMYGLMIALLATTVAYAVLQTTLNISGTVTKKGGSWDIHFANLSTPTLTGDASVENADLQGTTFDFDATVVKPGDSIVYTFDVVNGGTIDATLDSYTLTGATEAKAQDITYTLTYADGKAITKGDSLKSEQTRSLKLTVSYDDVEELGESTVTLDLGAVLIYVQTEEKQDASLNGDINSEILADGREVYLNPETGALCEDYVIANSNDGVTTGCLKWYAFGDNGTSVNLLLDHDIATDVGGYCEYDDHLSECNDGAMNITAEIQARTPNWTLTGKTLGLNQVLEIIDYNPGTSTEYCQTFMYDDTYKICDPNVTIDYSKATGFTNFPEWLGEGYWIYGPNYGIELDQSTAGIEDTQGPGRYLDLRPYVTYTR